MQLTNDLTRANTEDKLEASTGSSLLGTLLRSLFFEGNLRLWAARSGLSNLLFILLTDWYPDDMNSFHMWHINMCMQFKSFACHQIWRRNKGKHHMHFLIFTYQYETKFQSVCPTVRSAETLPAFFSIEKFNNIKTNKQNYWLTLLQYPFLSENFCLKKNPLLFSIIEN